jgi:3-hydroxyacyl-[acyl-carrier-protein] dehydratase
MNVTEIQRLLPHRYPFLMLDRVIECEPGVRVVALKNVTANEPQFQGHFPNWPVFPGVYIVEAMAQAAGIIAMTAHPDLMGGDATRAAGSNKLVYLAGLDGFRFRKPVTPGDQLRVTVEKLAEKRSIWKFSAKAEVDGKLVAEGEILATVADAQ